MTPKPSAISAFEVPPGAAQPGPEPEHDHRQVQADQAEFVQQLPGLPGGGVVDSRSGSENR